MSLRRKTFTLALGEGAARLLGVAIYVLLARALTVEDFGIFSAAMTFALLVGVVVDFGQNSLIGRVAARDAVEGAELLATAGHNKVLLGLSLSIVVILVALVAGTSTTEALTLGVMVVWATFLGLIDIMRGFSRARGHMGVDSAVNASESTLRIVAVGIAWLAGAGLVALAAGYAAASAVAVFGFLSYLKPRYGPILTNMVKARGRLSLMKRAMPLGLSSLAMAGFYRVDQVLVRVLAGAEASAYYGAAARIAFTAAVLTTLVASAAYPDMSRARGDARAMRDVLLRSFALAVVIGALAGGAIALGARPFLVLLYGSAYAEAAGILRLLACVVFFNAVSTIALYAANSLELERRVLGWVGMLAIANIVLNVIFVPEGGAMAAALIAAAGETLLAGGLLVLAVHGARADRRAALA